MPDSPAISCVIPVYNEEQTLAACYGRVSAVLEKLAGGIQQIIFVNDGSVDRTQSMLEELAAADERVMAVRLSRNFGHQAAVSVGLRHATGDYVCVLDGDMQDPPEVLPEMIAALEAGADVAYGVRQHRKEHPLKKAAYAGFYRLMRAISDIDIPLDAGDFCVMRREVVARINALPEAGRFVRGLRAWVGGTQVGVAYERHERCAGRSKYTVWKLLGLASQGVFSFSSAPVKLVQLLGFGTSAVAIAVALGYLALYVLMPGKFPPGWATLVISIWFLAGVQLLSVGLLGEYIHRTFNEVRRRPTAFVAEVSSRAYDGGSMPCNKITLNNTPGFIAGTGGGEAESTRLSKPSAA